MWKWWVAKEPTRYGYDIIIAPRLAKGCVALYIKDRATGKLYPITIDPKEIPDAKSQTAHQLE